MVACGGGFLGGGGGDAGGGMWWLDGVVGVVLGWDGRVLLVKGDVVVEIDLGVACGGEWLVAWPFLYV
jgi:hypothetical protein